MSLGTCVIAGEIMPIRRVYLRQGCVIFEVKLPLEMEFENLGPEEYRIHADDGSLVALVDRVSSQRIRKERGVSMTISLPIQFEDNRAVTDLPELKSLRSP